MKSKFLIISFLVFSLMGAFAIKANAQDKTPAQKELIADETALTETKTGAKVECDNDELANKLMYAFKEDIKKFGWSWRKDKYGHYKHYVIYVSKETGNKIREWATKNF